MPVNGETYIRVSDSLPDHPKVEHLSDKAFRLLIESWCWCRRQRTEGRIPQATWERRGTPRARQELVDAGLVHIEREPNASGAQAMVGRPTFVAVMHDYLDWQQSNEQISERVSKRRSAGSLGNHTRWHLGKDRIDPNCEHCRKPDGTPPDRSQVPSQVRSQSDVANIANPSLYRGEERRGEKDANASSSATADPATAEPPRDDVEQLCTRLRDRVEANGLNPPRITAEWRRQARLLLDTDGRDLQQALRLINWCQADPFWAPNVMSLPKFRKQYDQLLARARQDQNRRGTEARARTTDDKRAAIPDLVAQVLGSSALQPDNVRALPQRSDP